MLLFRFETERRIDWGQGTDCEKSEIHSSAQEFRKKETSVALDAGWTARRSFIKSLSEYSVAYPRIVVVIFRNIAFSFSPSSISICIFLIFTCVPLFFNQMDAWLLIHSRFELELHDGNRATWTKVTIPTDRAFWSMFQSKCYTPQGRRATVAPKHLRPLT